MSAPSGAGAYPVDLAAQRRWHAERIGAPPPHPAPQVPARLATPEEIGRASRTLGLVRKTARSLGWACNVTYARGWSTAAPRAACAALCGKDAIVTATGKVRSHHAGPDASDECPGSGRPPVSVVSLDHGPLTESLALRMRHPAGPETRWGAVTTYVACPVGAAYAMDAAWFWLPPAFPVAVNGKELYALLAAVNERNAATEWTWLIDRLAAHREAASLETSQRAEQRKTEGGTARSARRTRVDMAQLTLI